MTNVPLVEYTDKTFTQPEKVRYHIFDRKNPVHDMLAMPNVAEITLTYTDGSWLRWCLVHPVTRQRFDVRADTYGEGFATQIHDAVGEEVTDG
jgi:hypothetical protein